MEYIWFDNIKPIKKQLPKEFKSAAIILNPFIKIQEKLISMEFDEEYPSQDELLKYGNPVKWSEIIKMVEFNSYEELEIALRSSIKALNDNFIRMDLADELEKKISHNIYYPCEDIISEFIFKDFFEYFTKKQKKKVFYRRLTDKHNNCINFNEKSNFEIYDSQMIIFDENLEYALMSIFDSFFSILLSKSEEIGRLIEEMEWESIICTEETTLNWFLEI